MIKIAFCDDDLSVLKELSILMDRYRVERNQDITYAAFHSPLELLAERDALPEHSGESCAVLPRVRRDRDESQLRQWLATASARSFPSPALMGITH